MGASIESMELLLEKQDLSGLEIIITKGYIDLLKHYLPEYLLQCDSRVDESKVLLKPLIHIAITKGFIHIVSFLHDYFIDVCPPPAFDLHYIVPETGENSALVAARSCNLPMVRFLNETCKVDFSIFNVLGQNALILAVIGTKQKLNTGDLIVYLITECNVDIRYYHEYISDKLDNPEIMEYTQKILLKYGIAYHKKELKENKDHAISPFKPRIKIQEESQATIAAMSSISAIDITKSFSISMLQEEI